MCLTKVVLVCGEPGIGKSRLVAAFAAPLARPRLAPAAQQQFEFLVAPDQGRQLLRSERFETTLDLAQGQDLPGLDRGAVSLDSDGTHVAALEESADQLLRTIRDDNRARFGQALQPGSEIRRLADLRC